MSLPGSDRAEQYALYVQDEYRAGSKLLLIPSIRYDHHDSFGSHTSPNLGATYFIDDNSRFKANYGSAYRSPSVDELYGDFSHGRYVYRLRKSRSEAGKNQRL